MMRSYGVLMNRVSGLQVPGSGGYTRNGPAPDFGSPAETEAPVRVWASRGMTE